jgi:hypothetical protein
MILVPRARNRAQMAIKVKPFEARASRSHLRVTRFGGPSTTLTAFATLGMTKRLKHDTNRC